ncbi:MAG: hypothetical protein ACREDT_08785 [Methylocella sp.]
MPALAIAAAGVGAGAIQARNQLFVVCGRPAVGRAFAKAIEDLWNSLRRVTITPINRPQLEEQPKIVQVPVEERVRLTSTAARPLKQSTEWVGLANRLSSIGIAVAKFFSIRPRFLNAP